MLRRVALFMLLNLVVVLTVSTLLQVLGIGPYLGARGIDYGALAGFCLVWGMGGALVSLALSRVTAKAMMGVRVLDPAPGATRGQEAQLLRTVARLAQQAQLPATPEVGIYASDEVNAFATGPTRARALVAVSSGLLAQLDGPALEAVLAHEVAHVANGDMVTMTLLQGVVNAFVMFLARAVAYAVTQGSGGRDADGPRGREASPWLAYALQMALEVAFMAVGSMLVAAFSRWREFRADHGGARLAGRAAMVGALRQLQRLSERDAPSEGARAPLATLMIHGRPSGLLALLRTHPPLEARIARLLGAPGAA